MDGTVTHDSSNGTQPFYITRSGATNQTGRLYADDSTFVFDSIQDETGGAAFMFRSTNASVTNQNVLELNPVGVFVNQDGANQDFRVETSANTHALFVDAGANAVHINGSTDVDDHPLVVHAGTNANAIAIRGRSDDIGEISFFENDATTKVGSLQFRNNYARLDHRASGGSVNINVGPALAQIVDHYETGAVFNESGSNNIDFRIESDSQSHMFFVDASENSVLINNSSTRGDGTNYSSFVTRSLVSNGSTEAPFFIGYSSTGIGDGFIMTSTDNTSYLTAASFNDYVTDYETTFVIRVHPNSTPGNYVESMRFGNTSVVVNEQSRDCDFRVESNNNANMFFVNAGADTVHLGSSSGSSVLNVYSTGRGSSVIALNVVNEDSGSGVNTLFNTTNNIDQDFQIKVSEVGASVKATYIGPSTNTNLILTGASVGTLNKDLALSSSSIVVNQDSRNMDFRVEGNGQSHALFVDASNDRIGIRTSAPTVGFEVNTTSKFQNTIDVFNGESHFTNSSTYTDPNAGVGRAAKFSGGGIASVSAYIGTLSKGSGSFQIDHPLPEKTETHHLVHSFVEAPQADNIYRGKVELVAGQATVNIDTIAGMTEGTFVLLNRDVQCFTTNEAGWTAVRGSVSGNILTVEAQDNTCTDTVSWLVIGERQDQHMYDTDWTDENGKVIVEPLKPEPQP
jgi:hypothetical protein